MLLGILLTACTDYDCVNQGFVYEPARHWRGSSIQRPAEAWNEQDRFVTLRNDEALAEAWTRFDLETELGYPAPPLDAGALGVLYRTEFSGSCLDHSNITAFFEASPGRLGAQVLRHDVCAMCGEEIGGFYELWILGNEVEDLTGLTPYPCYITGPCYATPD